MNPVLRNSLMTACAFAKVFLESADAELLGAPAKPRREAQDQLAAALRNLEDVDEI